MRTPGADWTPAQGLALHAGAGQQARTIRRLVALGLAVAMGLLAFGGIVLLKSRQDVWARAEHASANLALAIERDISRHIALIDRSLRATSEVLHRFGPEAPGLEGRGLEGLDPELRHAVIFGSAAGADYLSSVIVLGPGGEVVRASDPTLPEGLRLAGQDLLLPHRDGPGGGLFIGRPFADHARGGVPSIVLSRRLEDAEERFAGVVAGILRLDFFHDLIQTIDLGPGGMVSIVRADGWLIARQPVRPGDLDRNFDGNPAFVRLSQAPAGRFVGAAASDGVSRLNTFRRLEGLPLVLNVSVAVDEVFAAWRARAVAFGLILGLLCTGLIALCLLFRREMRRRLLVERQLTAMAQDLATAARTDELTGLPNRRCLDETLDREWRRAAREGKPLSLLLLDLDCFKGFNDRYGHPAGDACLRAVAGALRASVRRSDDVPARYGGEELAAVLPGTAEGGALYLAERVREAVETLGIVHEGNLPGVVTASIGCATLSVTPEMRDAGPAALLDEADRALYEAKRTGRNRVIASGRMPTSSAPPEIPDEAGRLVALAGYHDGARTPRSDGLDRIARLTAGLLGVPVGLVSLVGQEAQFLVGRHGLDLESTPRSVSFCAHTITGVLPMVVPDAAEDARFRDNPLVIGGPRIRFYAGAPLISATGGHRLGALCIIDRKPHGTLDVRQRALLMDLAALAVDELERGRVGRVAMTEPSEAALARWSA